MKYAKFGHSKWHIAKSIKPEDLTLPEDYEIPTLSVTIYKKSWSKKGGKPVKKGDHLTFDFPGIDQHVVGEVTDVDDDSFKIR